MPVAMYSGNIWISPLVHKLTEQKQHRNQLSHVYLWQKLNKMCYYESTRFNQKSHDSATFLYQISHRISGGMFRNIHAWFWIWNVNKIWVRKTRMRNWFQHLKRMCRISDSVCCNLHEGYIWGFDTSWIWVRNGKSGL